MGSGLSSTIDTEHKAAIVKHLRDQYEDCKIHNKNDFEIQEKLIAEYNVFLSTLENQMHMKAAIVKAEELSKNISQLNIVTSSSTSKLDKNNSKKPVNSLDERLKSNEHTKKAPKPTRRRSFDAKSSGKKNDIKKMIEATTTAIEQSVDMKSNDDHHNEEQDHWDSVATQPYCSICAMAFKSAAFLERHEKFSDIHLRNVEKKEKADAEAIVQQLEADRKPIDGIDYKLLYSGTKLFWRTRDELDLSIYFHIRKNIIEVISNDLQKNKDYPRIYLDYTRLIELLQVSKESKEGDDTEKALSRYIISRIQLSDSQQQQQQQAVVKGSKIVEFLKTPSDPTDGSPIILINNLPESFHPVVIAKRRRTNGEEIQNLLTAIDIDRTVLVNLTNKAQNITELFDKSSNFFLITKKWWSDFNPIRIKWIKAIRRVIRQKLVAETKAHLLKLQKEKVQKSTTFLATVPQSRKSFNNGN